MHTSNLILIGYGIYLPVVIILTIYVAKTLFANGRQFMLDIFHGEEGIAMATNRLFEMGFYLMNIGFALYVVKIAYINNAQQLVETLAAKVGAFSIYLGVLLLAHLYLFLRGRKHARRHFKPIEKTA